MAQNSAIFSPKTIELPNDFKNMDFKNLDGVSCTVLALRSIFQFAC
jgi:hypothetical protein